MPQYFAPLLAMFFSYVPQHYRFIHACVILCVYMPHRTPVHFPCLFSSHSSCPLFFLQVISWNTSSSRMPSVIILLPFSFIYCFYSLHCLACLVVGCRKSDEPRKTSVWYEDPLINPVAAYHFSVQGSVLRSSILLSDWRSMSLLIYA